MRHAYVGAAAGSRSRSNSGVRPRLDASAPNCAPSLWDLADDRAPKRHRARIGAKIKALIVFAWERFELAGGGVTGYEEPVESASAVDRFARRAALRALPISILEAAFCLAVLAMLIASLPRQYGGAGVLATAGLTLIAVAAEVFLAIRLYGALRGPLHETDVLVGRPWPMLAFARLGCVVLVAIGLGLLTPMAVHLQLTYAMAAAAVVAWLLLHAATRGALNLGNPVMRLSEDGVWTARLGGPTPWSRFGGLRRARTPWSTSWVLTPDGKSEGAREVVLSPAGLDLTHGDLLRAIARLQPRLLKPHLS